MRLKWLHAFLLSRESVPYISHPLPHIVKSPVIQILILAHLVQPPELRRVFGRHRQYIAVWVAGVRLHTELAFDIIEKGFKFVLIDLPISVRAEKHLYPAIQVLQSEVHRRGPFTFRDESIRL